MLKIKHYYYVYFLAVLAFVSASPIAVSGGTFRAEASFAELNSTIRAHGEIGVDQTCFESYLPAPGIWMLEAGVSSSAGVEPRLEVPGQSGDARFFRYLKGHANRMMLEIHGEGTYQFCVSAQDPTKVLGNYKLTNTFVPSLKVDDPDEDEPEPDPFGGCAGGLVTVHKVDDPDEDEPEPDPFGGCAGGLVTVHKVDDPDEDEPEPDPFGGCAGGIVTVHKVDDPDEDEPEPDPFAQPALLEKACSGILEDDHSDAFECGTSISLGREIRAEIRNDWGDDADIFTFTLSELTSVQVATSGNSDVFGGLYDERGYRLAIDDDGGDGKNFRIAKALSRGRYYVKVQGIAGAEGDYSLAVQDLASR